MAVTIKNGGQLERVGDIKRLQEIKIEPSDNTIGVFEFWINDTSVSYLTVQELLDLKKEINENLQTLSM
jgi:hypothetical protein